jgi:hypothetical protein
MGNNDMGHNAAVMDHMAWMASVMASMPPPPAAYAAAAPAPAGMAASVAATACAGQGAYNLNLAVASIFVTIVVSSLGYAAPVVLVSVSCWFRFAWWGRRRRPCVLACIYKKTDL